MPDGDHRFLETVVAFLRSATNGFKGGPGVLGTITPLNIVGLIAVIIAVALIRESWMAILAAAGILGYLVYSSERAYRYAKADPLSALLSGSEMIQFIKEQAAARDRSIVTDAPPVIAASTKLIENSDV